MIHTLWAEGEANEALATWCAVHIGLPRPFQPPYVTMGVFDEERLIAVILYNNYQPEAGVIEFHGAGVTPRWLTRPVLREMFDYPFEIGCQSIVTRNSAGNKRLHRILKSIGFKHVTIPRLRGRDEAECIFWLTDDAWNASRFKGKD